MRPPVGINFSMWPFMENVCPPLGKVSVGYYVRGRKGQNRSATLSGKIIKHRKYYNNYCTRGRIRGRLAPLPPRQLRHCTQVAT